MRLLRALVAVALSVVVVGCTSDDPGPDDPSATWSPTGQIETPTGTPAPVEPVLPDAATEASEEGARAFIEYYWELVNYAQVTGDVKALKAASGPNCTGCASGVRGIKKVYKGGGRVRGGEYRIAIDKINQLQSNTSLVAFEALLTVENDEQTITAADGAEHVSAAGTSSMAVAMQWSAGSWRMEVMDPR